MNNAMGKLQGRGIFLYDLRRALIVPEKIIPEKRVLYVRGTGKHCGFNTRIRDYLPGLPADLNKEHTWD